MKFEEPLSWSKLQAAHEQNQTGAELEERYFSARNKLLQRTDFKDTVVISGWRDKEGKDTHELDFLVIDSGQKCFLQIEAKSDVLSRKRKEEPDIEPTIRKKRSMKKPLDDSKCQFENWLRFSHTISSDKNWTNFKLLASQPISQTEACAKFQPFVIGQSDAFKELLHYLGRGNCDKGSKGNLKRNLASHFNFVLINLNGLRLKTLGSLVQIFYFTSDY